MPHYVDITVPLVPGRVPLYPGDTELVVERAMSQQGGSPNNVSWLTCSVHCGTHVELWDEALPHRVQACEPRRPWSRRRCFRTTAA
jgi:hypothetical protein